MTLRVLLILKFSNNREYLCIFPAVHTIPFKFRKITRKNCKGEGYRLAASVSIQFGLPLRHKTHTSMSLIIARSIRQTRRTIHFRSSSAGHRGIVGNDWESNMLSCKFLAEAITTALPIWILYESCWRLKATKSLGGVFTKPSISPSACIRRNFLWFIPDIRI